MSRARLRTGNDCCKPIESERGLCPLYFSFSQTGDMESVFYFLEFSTGKRFNLLMPN